MKIEGGFRGIRLGICKGFDNAIIPCVMILCLSERASRGFNSALGMVLAFPLQAPDQLVQRFSRACIWK